MPNSLYIEINLSKKYDFNRKIDNKHKNILILIVKIGIKTRKIRGQV